MLPAAINGFSQCNGQVGNAERMATGGWITLFNGMNRCPHEPFKQVIYLLQQLIIFDGDRRLTGHGFQQPDQRLIKRQSFSLTQLSCGQLLLPVFFTVNKLNDTNNAAIVALHRNHQH